MNLLQELEKESQDFVLKTNQTKKILVDGRAEVLPVYKIKLDLLYYNDQNDRIATWINRYKTENSLDEFDKNNIESYNNTIEEFINESNSEALKKTENNIRVAGQLEPGVVLIDGRVIDGNRRFTCLRRLSKKDIRFNYFDAVILNKDININSKYIKMLELHLQHLVESKVDYNPIDRLVGIYTDIEERKLLTLNEYSRFSGIKEKELTKSLEVAQLMVEFLEFISKPKQFYLARELDLNGPLLDLNLILKKENDEDKREDIKNIAFGYLLTKPKGDMTRYIRDKIGKILKSEKSDEFIEKALENTEKIIEKITENEDKKIETAKEIISDIRKDENLIYEMAQVTEKYIERIKREETREQPIRLIEKVSEILKDIDTNIFAKLNKEELIKLENKINDIRDELDLMIEKIKL